MQKSMPKIRWGWSKRSRSSIIQI